MIKMLSLADLITILNAVLGFLAILLVFSNQFPLAAAFILLGLLADGLDGMVARRRGNGPMGQFLETIADMLSLAVAPLLLLYIINYDAVSSQLSFHLLFIAVSVFILVCSMIRLSSFPTLKEKQFFVGLPTSINAIFLVTCSLLNVDLWYILPFLVLFAVLMISPVRFPKQGGRGDLLAAVFIIWAILLLFLSRAFAPVVLLVGLLLYLVGGPVYLAIKKRDDHSKGT
jgi:archaetidylserine synthase